LVGKGLSCLIFADTVCLVVKNAATNSEEKKRIVMFFVALFIGIGVVFLLTRYWAMVVVFGGFFLGCCVIIWILGHLLNPDWWKDGPGGNRYP
jgi:hypothetical protein